MDLNAHWIVKDDVGIRVFPRCGSTTLLRTYTYNQSREKWLKCPRRFIVVRSPWDRLLSAWAMFWPLDDACMETRGYPPCKSLDELLTFLCSSPPMSLDLHTRSMHLQLEGVSTQGASLVSLAYMLKNPPIEVSPTTRGLHFRKTIFRPSEDHSPELYAQWAELYKEDLSMWRVARKLPNEQ